MPRQTYTSTPDHTTDAGFTAWAKQLSDAIKLCLTQTSDTGQVDWTTVKTRPAVGVYTFYEIYRFSDALQSTKPIFIRIEYGTATAGAAIPNIRIGMGTGTNGAGTLTSSISPNAGKGDSNAGVQTTYVCYKDGCFTLAWGAKLGAGIGPAAMVVIERTRDASGASNGNGCQFIFGGTSQIIFTYGFSPVSNSIHNAMCLTNIIQSAQSASVAVVNLFNWYAMTPDLNYLVGILTYKNGEIPQYAEIDVAIVGTTPRHYVCLGQRYVPTAGWSMHNTQIVDVPAILWEV